MVSLRPFAFRDDAYRAVAVIVDGVVEGVHDYEILDESGDWKAVKMPSPDLEIAAFAAAHDELDKEQRATSADRWPA
jgi:hypothetical protein